MKKDYTVALKEFVERLQAEQRKGFKARGVSNAQHLIALHATGRRYDRVQVQVVGARAEPVTKYFVDKETGEIYGAKSAQAPNLKWYFGTIYTAHKWDWSDVHGIPVSDRTVRAVKTYGPYTQYMKV